MLRTQTLAGEPIMELADFREQELVREVREQFHPMEEKSSFFLTREMIREFIDLRILAGGTDDQGRRVTDRGKGEGSH